MQDPTAVTTLVGQLAPIILAIATLISSLSALIVAIKGNEKIEKVNGNMLKFIEASKDTAEMKGKLAGITEGLQLGSDVSSKTVVLPDRRASKPEDREP